MLSRVSFTFAPAMLANCEGNTTPLLELADSGDGHSPYRICSACLSANSPSNIPPLINRIIRSPLIGGPFSNAILKSNDTLLQSPVGLLIDIAFNGCARPNSSSKNPLTLTPCLPKTKPQSAISSIATNSSQIDSNNTVSFVRPELLSLGSLDRSILAS